MLSNVDLPGTLYDCFSLISSDSAIATASRSTLIRLSRSFGSRYPALRLQSTLDVTERPSDQKVDQLAPINRPVLRRSDRIHAPNAWKSSISISISISVPNLTSIHAQSRSNGFPFPINKSVQLAFSWHL